MERNSILFFHSYSSISQAILFLILIKLIFPYCLNQQASTYVNILGFKVSPDGKYLAIAHGSDNVTTFHHLQNITLIYTYNFTRWVDRVTYSKNGAYVVISGSKNQIDISNGSTFQLIRQVYIGKLTTHKVAFSYDDKWMLICGNGYRVLIFSTTNWSQVYNFNQSLETFHNCQFSPNGEFFATGYYGAKLYDSNYVQKVFWNFSQLNRLRSRMNSKENRSPIAEEHEGDAEFEGRVVQLKQGRASLNSEDASIKRKDPAFALRSKFLTSSIGNR